MATRMEWDWQRPFKSRDPGERIIVFTTFCVEQPLYTNYATYHVRIVLGSNPQRELGPRAEPNYRFTLQNCKSHLQAATYGLKYARRILRRKNMTYKDEGIIKEMLENDGCYPGDPQMAKIYAYEGQHAEKLFAVFAHESHDDMHLSPYVFKLVLLWTKNGGLTPAGREWLRERLE